MTKKALRVPRTYRLPPDVIASVEARAKQAGTDNTEVVVLALRAYLRLPPPAVARPGRIAPVRAAEAAERAPAAPVADVLTDRAAAFRAAAARRGER